ncbi:MAG: TolC family protein [Pseudomonadota bacterium]
MKRILLLALGTGLSACASIGTVATFEPDAEVPEVVSSAPDTFMAANVSEIESSESANWWRIFNDPVLDQIVGTAQSQNFDIQEAAARLQQANAAARQTASAQGPTVTGAFNTSFSDSPLAGTGFGGFGGGGSDRLQIETVTPSLGASYELDLFGRTLNDTEASKNDAIAAFFDVKTIRQSAVNEAIRTYFEIVDIQAQIALQEDIIDLIAERVASTESRFSRGLAESFELYQLDQDLRSLRASIPQQKSALEQAKIRLALILGEYRPQTHERLATTLAPQLSFNAVATPQPITVLEQRPDVQAAWARAEAARRRIGARKAERFPNLSFSASLGSQGANLSQAIDVLDNWTLSLAQNLGGTIFDNGRAKASIEAAEGIYAERLATYAETVVRAHGEVEAALEDFRYQTERYQLISSQLRAAQNSFDTQRRRFERGNGSYTSVLDAQRSVLQTRSALASSGKDLALARLGIHRALGGDWGFERPEDPTQDNITTASLSAVPVEG